MTDHESPRVYLILDRSRYADPTDYSYEYMDGADSSGLYDHRV